MEIVVSTSFYGDVTVRDCVIEDDFKNLVEGVDIHDEDGEFMCNVYGVSADELENDPERVEQFINEDEG